MNAGGDTHSSEADLEANPDGSKMYGVWAQWVFENDDYDGGDHRVRRHGTARLVDRRLHIRQSGQCLDPARH